MVAAESASNDKSDMERLDFDDLDFFSMGEFNSMGVTPVWAALTFTLMTIKSNFRDQAVKA